METVANVLVGLVAALHAYILVLEMFLWEREPGRGLHGFDAEMARFCGRTARVKARANRCVDERTGRMLTMKYPCIILEDIVCEGVFKAEDVVRR